MDNFLLGKSNFCNCLKNQNIRKFTCKTRYSFVKLPEKIEIFRKFACRNRIFLPGSTTPQISNQIDAAAVAILLLISLWHHRRSCFLSIAEFLDLFYNFLCNYYLHYLILILCLLSRLLSFYYLFLCCNSLTPYSIYSSFFAGRRRRPKF